ncbi:sulfotransferase family protein [Acaryochloris sp. IP29b_bin.137]|uniref:sulfotransferase family protein n=1 Tax=Acaryochloris sp. IP29b_bin.137 TaxID=2969217 RepID=UPI002623F627|nr:sulfotransferase family protein [Acaryochloris sp. IP29b_bin.137]
MKSSDKLPKVFCIGLIKTGTTSLGYALKMLGYNHTTSNRNVLLEDVVNGNLQQIFAWVDQYDSFDDWPWPFIYRELDSHYPDSRFILTTRLNEEIWLRSVLQHSEWCGPSSGREKFFGHAMPQKHERQYINRYREHHRQVRDYFRNRPDKLLEVCWEKGQGWPELCSFLNMPVPNAQFPCANTKSNRINK